LARLLAEYRGVPNPAALPPLTIEQILMWADAHHARTSRWPSSVSGPVVEEPSLTWAAIQQDLREGYRGLPKGLSVAQLLVERRGARRQCYLPLYSVEQILAWADAYWERTGRWPNRNSGWVEGEPFETWRGINSALAGGYRGLPGGASLVKLLAKHRGVRTQSALPQLGVARILAWADAYYRRMDRWPVIESGKVEGSSGETWSRIDTALRKGLRGLAGGSSLPKLLAEHRGVANTADLPRLTVEQILEWADAYRARTGKWPTSRCGRIEEEPTATWTAVNAALSVGKRGLPGGTSLARLLVQESQHT
jgi:hypothetical protein